MKEPAHAAGGSRPLHEAVSLASVVALAATLVLTSVALTLAGCGDPPPPVGDDAGPVVIGASCSATAPCGLGLTCLPEFPGGYCTALCEDASCPSGSVCDRAISPPLCTDACSTRSECRDGYQCWRGGCVPACAEASTCGAAGATCEGGQCVGAECTDPSMCPPGWDCVSGVCAEVPDGGPMLLGLGVACTMDAECGSGICLPPARGGICTRACSDALQCSAEVTFSAACGPATRGGEVGTYCLPYNGSGALNGDPCGADAECQSNTCVAGSCTEACNEPRDCTLGLSCGSTPFEAGTFMGCGFPAGNPYEVLLPEISLMAGFGNSLQRVALPPDVASVTLQCAHRSGDSLPMAFNQVTQAAGGTTLEHFDLGDLYDWIDQPNRWIPSEGYDIVSMGLPNSTPERVMLRQSSLRFSVVVFSRTEGDTGSATIQPSALIRRGRDTGAGTLDLAVHLVGVGVTAAAAPDNTRVQAMLTRMDEILAATGIRRGATSYHDVSSTTLSVIDTAEGPDSELAQLFRLSAGRTGRVLSLFLVRSIDAGGDGFNTLGIAGGIPGAVGVHGTMHSGVAIAFDRAVVGDSGRLAGHIAAHEGGHYLGLFHVSERIRACTGTETPETTMCMPFGGGDPISDTTYGDTSNLMNWSLIGMGSNTGLSSGQALVLRHSNLVSWP